MCKKISKSVRYVSAEVLFYQDVVHFTIFHLILQRMVCHGQHTYVYSQVLIQVLSQEPKGGFNMKRLSQEITKYALQKYVILI